MDRLGVPCEQGLSGSDTRRATSHMRLRVRAHSAPSALIGGQNEAGPSSLEYVKARWM